MLKVDEEEGMLHSHLPFILSGDPARIATPYSLQILHPHSPGPHYEGTCTPQECGGGGISCILTQGPDIFQKKMRQVQVHSYSKLLTPLVSFQTSPLKQV